MNNYLTLDDNVRRVDIPCFDFTADETDDVTVGLSYPNINTPETNRHIKISLSHVRAADNIRIHYDGNRDGWAIEQQESIEYVEVGYTEYGEWKEVAFIKAWGLETQV